jgi:hypothetical protein
MTLFKTDITCLAFVAMSMELLSRSKTGIFNEGRSNIRVLARPRTVAASGSRHLKSPPPVTHINTEAFSARSVTARCWFSVILEMKGAENSKVEMTTELARIPAIAT